MLEHRTQHHLLRIVDLGLFTVLMVAPLLMGGRHPMGRLVLSAIVWGMSVAWFGCQLLRREAKWSWSGAELVLLLAVALVIAQLAPWPASWCDWLSPAQSRLLPLWNTRSTPDAALGTWRSVSLTPQRTRQGLCLLATYAMLFLVSFQRIRTLVQIERLLKWAAAATIGMATIGLLQYLFGNGKFLGFYDHPTRNTLYTVKGTFANQNHFAHFLALGIGPLFWWLGRVANHSTGEEFQFHTRGRRPSTPESGAWMQRMGLGVVFFAGVLSFSRAGLMIMALAAAVSLAISRVHQRIDRKTVVYGIATAATLASAVAIHGHQRLSSRLETLTTGSIDQLDPSGARRKIWTAVCQAVPDFLRLGAGVGSHREVYPTYMHDWSDVEYTHAENGYLQILLETGIPGFCLLLIAVFTTGYWIAEPLRKRSSPRITACVGAIAAGWVASIAHAFVDFNWYIPACMSFTILLMAAAARLRQLSGSERQPITTAPRLDESETADAAPALLLSRWNWSVCVLAVLFVGVLCLQTQRAPAFSAPHWEAYLGISLAEQRASEADETRRKKADGDPADLMADHLAQALHHDPCDARAHLRLATNCLRRFEAIQRSAENPMSLLSIREAAVASQFTSRKSQHDWLYAATGDHIRLVYQALYHTRAALRLGPLQGKAYLHLADLAFLEGRSSLRTSLITQARAVRPFDGATLYTAGYEALQAGRLGESAELYAQAFHRGRDIQQLIIESLATRLSTDAFVALFRPDRQALGQLFEFYRESNQTEPAKAAATHYIVALEADAKRLTGSEAAVLWDQSQKVHGYLRQLPQALIAAREAATALPTDYRLRYVFAARLQQVGHVDEAIEQFQWCQRRRPADESVQARLATLNKLR